MLNLAESLQYIKWYNLSSPRPIKKPISSIRYNCKKICSWSRSSKTIMEIKKDHISQGDQNAYYLKVFQLLTTERRLTGQYFLVVDLSPTSYESFQQPVKRDPFRYILNDSAIMYESSGSKFFKTLAGIQSGSDILTTKSSFWNF